MTKVLTMRRASSGSVRSEPGTGHARYEMTIRIAHSAARQASSGSSHRTKKGGGEGTGGEQQPVHLGEGQVGEDDVGLVLQQVPERGMGGQPSGGVHDAGDERVLEVVGLTHHHCQLREEPGDLGLDHGTEHGVPTTRKGAVERRPRDAGLAGEVVHRRLAGALLGDAA